MTNLKMTKNSLRAEQHILKQLETYLPTLQLKKNLLLLEVAQVKNRLERLSKDLEKRKEDIYKFSHLLTDKYQIDPLKYTTVKHVQRSYENIAGVDVPIFQKVIFEDLDYSLFDTPAWFESAIEKIRFMIIEKEKINIDMEKKHFLEKELKDVSIRVNLFEKILIPRTLKNIKKIKIFLSDQELTAISQAKVAKLKKVKV
ncbi:MAG: V-type ATP synthase subunit D [Parachlamydiales bacterium]|nr:V-type ATP synthase subunit D [Parachlamydiales bacterium]